MVGRVLLIQIAPCILSNWNKLEIINLPNGKPQINFLDKIENLGEELLNGEIEKTNDISKVILGQGWHSGELTIYHSFGKTETLYITEGMFNLGELEAYIRENGYNLDNIGFILIGISGLILIYLLICKYINRKIY